jgi:hypothetical protein
VLRHRATFKHADVNRLRGGVGGLTLACALAAVAAYALAGARVLLEPGRSVVGRNPSSDYQIMTWSLSWWPWAVAHWADPFQSRLLWPPGGFPTLWMTSIPVPALLALPLTLTAGPLVAYNVLMVAAIVLAAAGAYLLCFELTARVLPSLLGAAVFALSPYMLGHTLSQHLDLTFVFPLPLLALLGLRYIRGKTSGGRFVVGSALLLLVVAGSSLELFLDLAVVLVAVTAVALAFGGELRPQLLRLAARLGLAYAVCLPVLGPVAAVGLLGTHGAVQSPPSDYAVDLINVVVPTPTLLTGRIGPAAALSSHFVGNIGERDGYIGLPLLVICVLALRSHWRRGAWIAGLLIAVAFLLSLGPTLTAAGRPVATFPVSTATLPVVGNALPARMSVFATLGLACLCALWFARPAHRLLRLGAAVVLVASLLPDFSPPRHIVNAWAETTAFAWSTPSVPRGFVAAPGWRRTVPQGSTVLVVPTRDRTAAEWWQAESGLGFRLAMPETPFVPPALAAEPTVTDLANNVLQYDGRRLAAARLRAYLVRYHIAAVVTNAATSSRWREIVRAAVPVRPVQLGDSFVFRVPGRLKPATVSGELSVASAPGPYIAAHVRPRIAAWLKFDGLRAHVRAVLEHGSVLARAVTLSSRSGDAELPRAAVDRRGDAAVVFLEWRDGALQLRAATTTPVGWLEATLDTSRLPIWSPRVAVNSDGTVLASWVDDHGASRTLRAAAYTLGAGWGRPVTLDHGDGLAAVALRAAGPLAVAAWHDSLANEAHVVAAVYSGGTWHSAERLASGYNLGSVAIDPNGSRDVRWRSGGYGQPTLYFEAVRRGIGWGRPTELSRASVNRRSGYPALGLGILRWPEVLRDGLTPLPR